LLQTLTNQAKKGVICVYVGVGKEIAALKEVEQYLKKMEVFDKVSMVITTSNQPPTLHYLAPFSGMTIAEYFRDKGNDVVIVFDDLSNHSKAYREISLLLKNPPGREAYPGDIFYLHAALVERAGNISLEDGKEVSITAIPVAETMENDISGFIQTNLLSMTDGHIFFDINQLRKGRKPAVSTSLSVSRAGNQTRESIDKDLAGKIRDRLVGYRKVLEVTQFGAELSDDNQKVLDFGKKLMILFNQDLERLVPRSYQFLLFGLLFSGFWKGVPQKTMENEIEVILDTLEKGEIITKEELDEKIEKMEDAEDLKDFCEDFAPRLEKLV
jgi:F-type H+-transporting ATPase subunit alpha